MRFLLLTYFLFSTITFDPFPNFSFLNDDDNATRAGELMKKTRTALGCDGLESLSILGTSRQKIGQMETAGDLELMMILPSKFYKASVMSPMAGIEMTRLEVLNGENAWTDIQNNSPAGSNMMFRVGGTVNGNSLDAQKAMQLYQQQEWTRLMLGMIGQGPASVPLEFSYVGEAEAPDGIADVIEVKSKGIGFNAQLFLDQKTHRPLMLSYQGRKPVTRFMTKQISGEEAKKKTPEDIEKELKESREKAQAQAQQEPTVEIQIRFEDFKPEGKATLPHRITRTIDGQLTEEWTLTKFKINPSIKADLFEKK